MAFSCNKDGHTIYGFQYDLKSWIALKEDSKSTFEMTCCGNKAILKTSKLGTQFFAHKIKPKDSNCSTGGESAEHIHIKYLVMKELDRNGWVVEVEKRGVTPSGEEWIADIYAEKGKAKIAIEVQWSPQTFIETKRRQEKYAQSGVRCAWLLRGGSIKARDAIIGDYAYSTKDLPVFSIYKNKKCSDSTYKVYNVNKVCLEDDLIFDPLEPIELDLENFIKMLVSAKIKFRPKFSPYSELTLDIIEQSCWRCHNVTNTVVKVIYENTLYGIANERSHYYKNIYDCDKKTINLINTNFSKPYNFAPLRGRYSKTEKSSYIANSCVHCDSLMGRFFDRQAYRESYYSDDVIKTERLTVSRCDEISEQTEDSNLKEINYDVGKWVMAD